MPDAAVQEPAGSDALPAEPSAQPEDDSVKQDPEAFVKEEPEPLAHDDGSAQPMEASGAAGELQPGRDHTELCPSRKLDQHHDSIMIADMLVGTS